MKGSNQALSILFALTFLLLIPSEAHAYIDPGAGSYYFQLLIAGSLAFLYILKVYWGKIISFFRNLFSRKQDNDKNGNSQN